MYLYIELWKAKDAWLRLTSEERKAKIDQLLQEAKKHPITGVIPFSFRKAGDGFLFDGVTEQPVVIDDAVARPTGFRYAAAWMVPTRELIKRFEDRVESLGWWFEYFHQENAWGVMDVAATVGDMIKSDHVSVSQPENALRLGRLSRTELDLRSLKKDVDELKKSVLADQAKAGPK